GDVDDFVSVEHGQVGGFAEFFDQVGQVGVGPGAEHAGGFVAQAAQAGAQGVAAWGEVADVSVVDQGAADGAAGGPGQAGGVGELAEGGFSACVGHDFQQGEGAVQGLYTAWASGCSCAGWVCVGEL